MTAMILGALVTGALVAGVPMYLWGRGWQHKATHDPLTGAWNRRFFDRNRFNGVTSVVMVDLDHFKAVNDVHGHEAGDQLLKKLAEVARRVARRQGDFIRWGGEEFFLYLPGTSLVGAKALADDIREAFAQETGHTFSAGVAELVRDERLEELLARADEAVYTAKAKGRNRVEVAA